MGIGTFAAMLTRFNVFLGIIPGATGIRHHDRQREPGSQAADQQAKHARNGKPTVVLAHTVKGKGVSFMENQLDWHGKAPNDAQYQQAIAELQGAKA